MDLPKNSLAGAKLLDGIPTGLNNIKYGMISQEMS